MRQITDATFAGEVSADSLVIVDMYADWCAPCKALAPVLEAAVTAAQLNGIKVEAVKLDIDTNPVKPKEYGVRSIPTLLFFRGGRHLYTIVGSQSIDVLQSKIAELDSATTTTV